MVNPKVQKNCNECKKDYLVHFYRAKESNFCSMKCVNNNKIGKPSWNKGLTKETDDRINYNRPTQFKEGIEVWNKGKEMTMECRIKNSMAKKPRDNFEGFIELENNRIRKSNKYKEWVKSIFRRDDFTCQFCYKKGGDLESHHIKPFSLFINNRFNIGNGMTLCKSCHNTTKMDGNKLRQHYEVFI